MVEAISPVPREEIGEGIFSIKISSFKVMVRGCIKGAAIGSGALLFDIPAAL